ncbi:MAG: MBOAT family protein [Candidatus Aminicenantes bacterium]|nr:MBOAT family protein [Candidatus Aminicenantes bacterium]
MAPLDPARLAALFAFDPAAPLGFVSGFFLVFLLILLLLQPAASRRRQSRVLLLLLFSLYFYYKVGGLFLGLLVLSTAADFGLGLAIAGTESKAGRRAGLWAGIAANLAVLFVFKYSHQWIGVFQGWGWLGPGLRNLALPVGISYYAFQKIGYLADVRAGRTPVVKSFPEFLLFVSFFPRVTAGPILRAKDFFGQLDQPAETDKRFVGGGVSLILAGLFKKAVIADFIGVNFVDRVFASPGLYSGLENLIAVYGYAVQIYCDFSGYTDMALGIGRLVGLRLPPNFQSPYKALTVSDFWLRWHMTLSFWLRDYIFWPLALKLSGLIKPARVAGLRTDKIIPVAATLVVFLVCGVWHGAAWGFVIWGLMHGLAVAVERTLRLPQKARKSRKRRLLARVLTFHYVGLAWIFFRADSPGKALAVVGRIFGQFKLRLLPQFLAGYPLVSALIALGLVLHLLPEKAKERARLFAAGMPLPAQSAALAAMIWLVFQFRTAAIQPFIYFKF